MIVLLRECRKKQAHNSAYKFSWSPKNLISLTSRKMRLEPSSLHAQGTSVQNTTRPEHQAGARGMTALSMQSPGAQQLVSGNRQDVCRSASSRRSSTYQPENMLLIFLIATSLPVLVSSADTTTPKAPDPICKGREVGGESVVPGLHSFVVGKRHGGFQSSDD